MKSNIEGSIPLDRRCTMMKYDETGIWFIDKADGVLSHPNKESKKGKTARTILNAEYFFDEECYRWENSLGELQNIYLTHRLDSPTSGIMVTCDNYQVSVHLKKLFKERLVKKTYYALVRPRGRIKDGIWKDNLKESRENGRIRVSRGNGPEAVTRVFTERKSSGKYGLAMLRMEPLTGRTHQLRVQCALRGIPIIGDKSYGDFSYNRKLSRASKTDRLCLHAAEIEFELKTNNSNKQISSDSPLPRAMGKLMM